jgi:hypothetical protein
MKAIQKEITLEPREYTASPRPKPPRYDRAKILRRAHALARKSREEAARKTYDLEARVVGVRIIHARTFAAVLAATPCDFGAAMKAAWAEAKGVQAPSCKSAPSAALVLAGSNVVAFDFSRAARAVLTAAHRVAELIGRAA